MVLHLKLLSNILIPFQLNAQDSQISVAPSESTMSVKGMRSPFYNEKSELIAELIGGRAFLLSSDFVNIEHVRINLYNEKKELTQLYTPNCKARISVIDGRKQIVVESEDWVVLKNANVEVIGRGFKFDTHNQYFEIRNDVKITTDFAVFKDSEEML